MTMMTTTTTMFHGMTITKCSTHHLDLPSSSLLMSPVHARPTCVIPSKITLYPFQPFHIIQQFGWQQQQMGWHSNNNSHHHNYHKEMQYLSSILSILSALDWMVTELPLHKFWLLITMMNACFYSKCHCGGISCNGNHCHHHQHCNDCCMLNNDAILSKLNTSSSSAHVYCCVLQSWHHHRRIYCNDDYCCHHQHFCDCLPIQALPTSHISNSELSRHYHHCQCCDHW